MEEIIRHALRPTLAEISALRLSTNGKIAAELLGSGRRNALDIGCGEGKFTRTLTGQAGEVSGVDVKVRSIEAAQATARAEGVKVDFRVASGEDLPWPDGQFEVVAFSNSLHHMPTPAKALAEAARVLAHGGLLYVMEPVPSGNYHEATHLVNDETVVRTLAYRALLDLGQAGFSRQAEIMYRSRRTFESFEEWKADQIDRDDKRRAKFDAQSEVVRAKFEGAARHEDGKLAFDQVFRVDVWKKL